MVKYVYSWRDSGYNNGEMHFCCYVKSHAFGSVFCTSLSLGFPTAQLIKEFRKAKSSLSMSLPYFGLRLLAGNETNGKMFKTNN